MPLNPDSTNVVECSTCGWKRVIDHTRGYRGGHTNPTTMVECHEMLTFSQASPLPIEMYLLGELRPKATQGEIDQLALSEDPNDNADAVTEAARNATLDAQIAGLYELEDADVDTALASAAQA